MRFILGLSFHVFLNSIITGQSLTVSSILKTETYLKEKFNMLYSTNCDINKDSLNNELVKTFAETLSLNESFFYTWPDLDIIGKVRSSDQLINVFTWHLQDEKSNYYYYGIIQQRIPNRRKDDKIVIHHLHDGSENIRKPETQLLKPENWYGALYYSIAPFSYRQEKWYILLGFDFNNSFSNKKIIEILKIEDEKPTFGGNIQTGQETQKRIILEYSSQTVTTLRYDEKLQRVVFDHLTPLDPILRGNFRFYVPDGSYDALYFHKGNFIMEIDVDARNY